MDRFFESCKGRDFPFGGGGGLAAAAAEVPRTSCSPSLDHDGVPWNNNNAEHAVKAFAYYREIADGQFTEDGPERLPRAC